jgi:glutamine amidotransferase
VIGIIDYGAGNIRSVVNALNRLGVPHFISNRHCKLNEAEKLIFPGVGEAHSAMEAIDHVELTGWMKEISVPFLGICLGMQLLFESTSERNTKCLGIVPGTIEQFDGKKFNLKVPHMGWNQVRWESNCPLFSGISSGEHFYFVHSYYAPMVSATIGSTKYGITFTSALWKKNYYGVQFHPEKSGKIGLQLLKNFVELC